MKLKTLRAIALTGAIALTAACSPGTDGAKGAEGGDKPALIVITLAMAFG